MFIHSIEYFESFLTNDKSIEYFSAMHSQRMSLSASTQQL